MCSSSIGKLDVYWLVWTGIILSVSLGMDVIHQFTANIHLTIGESLVHLSILVLVNWLFYRGFKQYPALFLGSEEEDCGQEHNRNTLCESDDMQKEVLQIERFMEKERPYINPDLTIKDMAKELRLPSRKLSHIINRRFNKNFAGFINDYRIDYAKERLRKPQDERETVLEIMYDVGFNSKSSFYTIFKNKTGRTPSEYRKLFAKEADRGNRYLVPELSSLSYCG